MASKYVLYHYESCPYCQKVRKKISDLGLKIEMRDIRVEKNYRTELIQGGGKAQVPCLRIEEGSEKFRWMYESDAINEFLTGQLA